MITATGKSGFIVGHDSADYETYKNLAIGDIVGGRYKVTDMSDNGKWLFVNCVDLKADERENDNSCHCQQSG